MAIKLQFYSDINFDSFLSDVASAIGQVPGEVREGERSLVLTQQQYEDDSVDLSELTRDYGGRILHVKGV